MSLKLITTEQFNGLDCNFYRNANDDIMLTREQIGTALEYSQPQQAITKIHSAHKDRLDKYSVCTKLVHPSGGTQDTFFYNHKGVMEICRWSRQSKADDFMDFTWEVMDRIIRGEEPLDNANNKMMNQLLAQNQSMMQTIITSQNTMTALLTTITSTLPQPIYPQKHTPFKTKTFAKLNLLLEHYNQPLSKIIHSAVLELEDSYDISLSDYQTQYMIQTRLPQEQVQILDVIEYNPDTNKLFTLTLNNILDQNEIPYQHTERRENMFTQSLVN